MKLGSDGWPNRAEIMKANETGTRVLDLSRRFLEHRHLPAVFAIGAMLVMLSALKTGSADFHWLRFVWRTLSYQPFKIPAIVQTVTLSGP